MEKFTYRSSLKQNKFSTTRLSDLDEPGAFCLFLVPSSQLLFVEILKCWGFHLTTRPAWTYHHLRIHHFVFSGGIAQIKKKYFFNLNK